MRIGLCVLAVLVVAPWAMAQTVDLTYAPAAEETARAYTLEFEGLLDLPQQKGLALKARTMRAIEIGERVETGTRQTLTFGAAEVTLEGEALPSTAEGAVAEYVVDGRGMVVEVTEAIAADKLADGDQLASLPDFLFEFALPGKEVAVGETWEVTQGISPSLVEQPQESERSVTAVKGKLVSLEDGVATIELEIRGNSLSAGYTTVVEAASVLKMNVETWTLLEAEAKLTVESGMGPGQGFKLRDVAVKVTREEE